MSDDVPDRPPTAGLADALSLRRNALAGLAVGALVALVAYLFRVLELFGPFAGTRQYPLLGPEGWFLLLAIVLASTTGLLVAAVLTAVSAYRLTGDLRDPE